MDVGALVEQVRAQNRERHPVFLPGKHFPAVFKLVVSYGHRIVTHGVHEFE